MPTGPTPTRPCGARVALAALVVLACPPAASAASALVVRHASVPPWFWLCGGLALAACGFWLSRRPSAPTGREEVVEPPDAEVDRLRREIERLRAAARRKDAFLSTVSHEFRTPLASIRSFSEILLSYENVDPKTTREFIGIIHEESERLGRLVDDLLDLTKIESGSARFRIVALDPLDVAESVVHGTASIASRRGIRLRFESGGDVPKVLADRDRLVQVLTNLVGNAIKFSPEGEAVLVRVEGSEDTALFEVADRGPGVPESERERIFETFHQVDPDRTDAPKGTGLGLSISREIVQRLGGRLWYEPRNGGGSRFLFTLPAADPAAVR